MKTVILAAGQGTRLGELTKNTPKPMIVLAGKPVVEHIMDQIRRAGVNDFALVVRYLREKIEDYFGDGSSRGIRVSYIPQPEAYGTGSALLAAKDFVGGDSVMMTFGDVVTCPGAYAGVMDVFGNTECDGAIALNYVADPWKGGAVLTNEERTVVTRIVEKPKQGEPVSHWMNSGIFAFGPVVFEYLEKLKPSPRGEYELPDAINAMIRGGLTIRPYFIDGPWQDVGSPEDLPAAEKILSEGAV